MKKVVTKTSQLQRERIVARNKRVFNRTHKALVECAELDRQFFSYPVMGFLPVPMDMCNFGARMANSGTHKRNNK